MKTAIVTTTIHVPRLLEKYAENARQNKHDCFFVVVGDKKTPGEARTFCSAISKKHRIIIYYLGIKEQERYLERFKQLKKYIPYNCVSRRNIGMLFAYEKQADVIITIDDDNFFVKGDYIKEHYVGKERSMSVLHSDTAWINPCDFLKEKAGRRFYHRGFPLDFRFLKERIRKEKKTLKVVVNAGFWLGEPDIDAITRLYYSHHPIESVNTTIKNNFALGSGTWSPFNSQNTALAREVVPAYFLNPHALRYDDIWASFVVCRIAEHLNNYIAFGRPLVFQERNQHNYWKDFDDEYMGMKLTTSFTRMLREISLSKKDYTTCYMELVSKLKERMCSFAGEEKERAFLKEYWMGMNVWSKTFRILDKH